MKQVLFSIENYLYKTDTSIRRTLLLVPKGVRLKRFNFTLKLVHIQRLAHGSRANHNSLETWILPNILLVLVVGLG